MKRRTLASAFFAACALLSLAVSVPATYAALRLFHDTGGGWGAALSAFALIVFEVGAVGAKLATLAIPEWRGRLTALTVALLVLTTGANYAHGYDLSQAADAAPTLAWVLSSWWGAVAATLAASALFPALLFVFLSAFVAQVGRGASQAEPAVPHPVSHRPAQVRRLVRRLVAEVRQERDSAAQLRDALRTPMLLPAHTETVDIAGRRINVSHLARELDLDRKAVYRLLDKCAKEAA